MTIEINIKVTIDLDEMDSVNNQQAVDSMLPSILELIDKGIVEVVYPDNGIVKTPEHPIHILMGQNEDVYFVRREAPYILELTDEELAAHIRDKLAGK